MDPSFTPLLLHLIYCREEIIIMITRLIFFITFTNPLIDQILQVCWPMKSSNDADCAEMNRFYHFPSLFFHKSITIISAFTGNDARARFLGDSFESVEAALVPAAIAVLLAVVAAAIALLVLAAVPEAVETI